MAALSSVPVAAAVTGPSLLALVLLLVLLPLSRHSRVGGVLEEENRIVKIKSSTESI